MLLRTIFAGLRSLCSVRNAHSPHCVTAVACPPRMSPYKRDLPQGSPLHPVFVSPARRKMLFYNIFAGLRSLCSVRNAHSPHCVTAVACPPRMSPYKRDLKQGSPLHPVFCISGQTKNVAAHHFCRAPFLVLRAQCALTALRHKIFFCATSAVLIYLSSRSGRRSLVISNAFFARQASTSWWLPETRTSGTDSPLYTCGRV